jgi:FAD:protein FMN transferase
MTYEISYHAMGSQMLAILDGGDESKYELEEVPVWFDAWEQTLSRFQPESELQRCNRSAGSPFVASAILFDAVTEAIHSAEETSGLVHPLMREAMEAAGYNRPFDELLMDEDQSPAEASIPDWRKMTLDWHARTIALPAGAGLDLGGVAKGWAADRAAEQLGLVGPALVDAGGDIAVSGLRADGSPWPIAVENPFDPDQPLCTLAVCGGGLATSGRDYHVWKRGGKWLHHILDPRSGRPAQTNVLTATVAAPNARMAEAAAKAALILGAEAGMRWVEAREHLAALLILEDGTCRVSEHMREMMWEGMSV